MQATLRLLLFFTVALMLFAVALVVELFHWFDGYTDQRIALVMAMVVLAPLAMLALGRHTGRLLAAGWGLFTLAVVLSTRFSITHQSELVEAIYYPAYLLAVAGLVWLWPNPVSGLPGSPPGQKARWPWLALVVALLAGVAFLYALVAVLIYGFALWHDLSTVSIHLPWGAYNMRFWSHTATWTLPLLPLAVLIGPLRNSTLWRSAIAFTGAIWWWLLLFSTSRGSLLGLLVAMVFAGVFFGRHCWPWLRLMLVYLLLGVLTWLLLSWLLPMMMVETVITREFKTHSSGRMPLWGEAWQMSLQYFPLGMGPQSWLTHEPLTEAYTHSRVFGAPHNMYLMWAAEYGWLGVGGLALIGLSGLQRFWQSRKILLQQPHKSQQLQLLLAVASSLVAAMTHATFSGIFTAPASMLLGLFVMAAFWLVTAPAFSQEDAGCLNVESSATDTREIDKRTDNGVLAGAWGFWTLARGLGVILVFSVMLFWAQQVQIYYKSMKVDLESEERISGTNIPRFWAHGYFPRKPSLMPQSGSENP